MTFFQSFGIEVGIANIHGNIGNGVARTLLDDEGDDEIVAIGRQLRFGGNDIEVGKAILQIIAAQSSLSYSRRSGS